MKEMWLAIVPQNKNKVSDMSNFCIRILKSVSVFLYGQVIWFTFFLGRPVRTLPELYNMAIPFIITGVCILLIGTVIIISEDGNIRSNKEAPRNQI